MMQKQRFIFLFILLTMLVVSGCKTKQIENSSDVIRIDEQNWTADDDKEASTPDSSITQVDTARVDSVNISEELTLQKKSKYRVAVILPFIEDSVERAWNFSSKKNFEKFDMDPASALSLSFTEGLLMAIQDAQYASKFDLKFFDDENSPTAISGILNQLKKDSFDLIIGPAKKSNLLSIANFAKKEGIMHVSPFSPSKSASAKNALYFMVEPSLNQHILTMINYSLDSVENPHFKFIYEQNASGKYYANLVSKYLNDLNDTISSKEKIAYSIIELGNDLIESEFELSDHIDAEVNNVVIANTFNQNFLTYLLPQIQQVKEDNEVLVFGMPGWENSETLRLDYLNTGEVHFTSSKLSKPDTIQSFISRYKEKYEANPDHAVYTGYELGSIFLKQLDMYGLGYFDNLLNETISPLRRKYKFIAVKNDKGEIERIENTALIVYKIHEFQQVKLR